MGHNLYHGEPLSVPWLTIVVIFLKAAFGRDLRETVYPHTATRKPRAPPAEYFLYSSLDLCDRVRLARSGRAWVCSLP